MNIKAYVHVYTKVFFYKVKLLHGVIAIAF